MSEKQSIGASIRIRPLKPTQAQNDQNCIKIDNNQLSVKAQYQLKHFDLPSIFPPTASQENVFETLVQPLVEDMFKGYSCAFLCYGQNGSGKSYTVQGGDTPQTKGVVSRLQDYISMKLSAEDNKETIYLLRVSYVEIYEEQVIDLLDVRRGKHVKVIQKGREVDLQGLQLKHIGNLQDIEAFFILGNRKRRYAYKKKLRNPQKCTSIFTLYLESLQKDGSQTIKKGKLHIVDLCAFTNICRVDIPQEFALKKSNYYDLSNNAIRNVILSLAFGGKDSQVPYSDSKVTLLLRQFFGGFGRTTILFHIYPGIKGLKATLDCLKLAKHLSLVENYPHCHLDPTKVTITSLLQQLQQTRESYLEISKQIRSLQDQRQGEPLLNDQNEFLSKSFIHRQHLQKLKTEIDQLQEDRIKLKKRIEGLSSLFLYQNIKDKEISYELKRKYLEMEEKRNLDINKVTKRSFGSSADYFGQEVEESGTGKPRARDRFHRQEIYELQKEFQEERQALLDKIRQLEGQFKFYQSVSHQTVKKDEIDLLRNSSHYDSTTRSYQLPKFTVLNKKLSLDRYSSPHSKSFTQRTFYLGGRSLQQLKGSISKRSGASSKVKQIKTGMELQEEYFRKEIKESQKNSKSSSQLRQSGSDEYELHEGFRKYKKMDGISKKRTFKPFSKLKIR